MPYLFTFCEPLHNPAFHIIALSPWLAGNPPHVTTAGWKLYEKMLIPSRDVANVQKNIPRQKWVVPGIHEKCRNAHIIQKMD